MISVEMNRKPIIGNFLKNKLNLNQRFKAMESVNYLIEPITTSRVSSDHRFISSNTQPVKMSHLLNDCVIPVFARDNEPTISNYEFVEAIYESVLDVFDS